MPFEQGHILDEQTEDALSFRRWHAGIIPNARELFGEVTNPAACFLVQCSSLLVSPPIILSGSFAMDAQLLVPFRFERVDDKAVVWVNVHVPAPRQLGVV